MSYVLVVAATGLYAASRTARARRRQTSGLSHTSTVTIALYSGGLLVLLLGSAWYLNRSRGICLTFVLFVTLIVIMNFALTRTHGDAPSSPLVDLSKAPAEPASTCAGCTCPVFMLCSAFAALGGLLSAGRLATASISSGTGDTNLNAIAAAVIGGTSLFGGRGSAYSALLGTLTIASISSGLTLMSLDSSIRFMITGAVLMVAVIVDSLSRRSRAAHGAA